MQWCSFNCVCFFKEDIEEKLFQLAYYKSGESFLHFYHWFLFCIFTKSDIISCVYFSLWWFLFQSAADFYSTLILLLTSLTVINPTKTYSSGWFAEVECRIWNSWALFWSSLDVSTWNLVCLAVERYENIKVFKLLYVCAEASSNLLISDI